MYEKENILDGCMMSLVEKQVPFPLGLKTDSISTSGRTSPQLREYFKGLVGYQFSWGVMTESFKPATPSKGASGPKCKQRLTYVLIPEHILTLCPSPDNWVIVLLILYCEHPLFNENFETSVGGGGPGLLELSASGEKAVTELRLFMCQVFLPVVLPNLLACLECLAELRSVNAKRFDEICRKAKELESKPLKFHRGSHILYDAIATADF